MKDIFAILKITRKSWFFAKNWILCDYYLYIGEVAERLKAADC